MFTMNTCDLCDLHKSSDSHVFRVLPGPWRNYGGRTAMAGPVHTVRCYEDNSAVKRCLESPGQGRVLVVDGSGSLVRALMGGQIAGQAVQQGWAGVLIHGAVRDLAELRGLALGIWARGHVPMPTVRQDPGVEGLEVLIQGVPVRPGEWLQADEDGVIVMAQTSRVSS